MQIFEHRIFKVYQKTSFLQVLSTISAFKEEVIAGFDSLQDGKKKIQK